MPTERALGETAKSSAEGVIVVKSNERSRAARVAKAIARAGFSAWILPRRLALAVSRLAFGLDRAFLHASESIARLPGARGQYKRYAFYRATLASCGEDVHFGWLSTFSRPQSRVGEHVYIGRRCSVGYACIESDVMLADGVQILSGGHQHGTAADGESFREQDQTFRCVTIGGGAWIGTNAIVMADVGSGAIVGAGAVVVEPIPPSTLAAGVPARVIRSLD